MGNVALAVVGQLTTMVLLMIVGFLLSKKGYLQDTKGLSIVLTKVAVPANMIVLLQREFSHEILIGFLKTGCGTLFLCVLGTIIFMIVGKCLKMDFPQLGLFAGGGVYSNVIFMGQPLVTAMFGAEGLIFCVAVMFASNVYLFTACSVLFSYKCGTAKPPAKMIKDAFFNLICFSAIIGIVLFVNSISLPSPLYNALNYASTTTVCLSMIVIGSLLAAAKVNEVLKDKTVYIFSFFTLIVMPVITKLIMGFVVDGVALGVMVILMGTPAAAALPSFAGGYGNDEKRASEYAFVSTVLSVITLPLTAKFLC